MAKKPGGVGEIWRWGKEPARGELVVGAEEEDDEGEADDDGEPGEGKDDDDHRESAWKVGLATPRGASPVSSVRVHVPQTEAVRGSPQAEQRSCQKVLERRAARL